MKEIFIKIIKAYQICLAPVFGHSCRFYPSCSSYAIGSIRECGVFRGAIRSFLRIVRCNPFSSGGYDPVKTK